MADETAETPAAEEAAPENAEVNGAETIQPAPTVGGSAERILNQDEIDSMLGFSLTEVALNENSGIRAIIESAMVSYERLPMLEIIFDRLVRLMTTSLRNFTSDNVEVSLDRITSVRFGDYPIRFLCRQSLPCSGPRSGTITASPRSIPA